MLNAINQVFTKSVNVTPQCVKFLVQTFNLLVKHGQCFSKNAYYKTSGFYLSQQSTEYT